MNMCPEKLSSKSQGRKQPILSVCAQYSQTVTAIGTGVKIPIIELVLLGRTNHDSSMFRGEDMGALNFRERRYGGTFPDMFMEQSGHDFARNKNWPVYNRS